MSNIISFSLYGNNPLYTLGAIENARLCNIIYPEWEVYIFVHNTVCKNIIKMLNNYNVNIIIIDKIYPVEKEIIAKCTFWRFLILLKKNINYVIFRDCDSRVNYKERACVDEWINSSKDFHMMYDHIDHKRIILAGMWGVKGNIIKNIKNDMDEYFLIYDKQLKYNRSYDEIFLNDHIVNRYLSNNNYIAHGDINECIYHIGKNIKITKFPKKNGELFIQTGINRQTFIGQTVYVPYSQKKPPLNKN